ncbi:MAG TPA: VWA domain-containing protein [Acidimicrobiia bacterium]|nr:VWA domain-containing protein [Acidimicrobiia bacterium]
MSGGRTLVEFGRRLRSEGVPVGSTIARDLATAVDVVGLGSAEDTYHAFRAVCVTAADQIPTFDRVFLEVFGRGGAPPGLSLVEERNRTWSIDPAKDEGGEGEGGEESAAVIGASWNERLAHKDFAELTPAEEARVRTLIAGMLWRPADARSRRRRPAGLGDRPDPRRTLRRLVGTEGDLLLPAFSERRRRRRPLIFIADVSGSMERYSEMLLYFAHAARGRLGRLEAFVFSTRLTRITRQLERRSPSEAIALVSDAVEDWSGGTRIGQALALFNRQWARRVGTGGPIVVIVSDGWDRGEPELLATEMARLSRSVHRVVWLNPLASRPGFAPETRGMKAALPYVDDFLAAGRLTDLASVVELLESVPERRSR